MKVLSILFLASLILGQVGGIPVYQGVVVYAHDILLALLLAEGFVRYAETGKFVKPKLVVPVLLFIFAAVFSLLTNSGRFAMPQLEVAAMYLVRWIYYSFAYMLVIQVFTELDIWVYGLFLSGVGLGILGLFQFFLYPDLRNLSYLGWDPHFYRLFSTFLDPNFAGLYLVLTIILGVFILGKKKLRIPVILGELIASVSLLLTYSRSSYLALIAAMIVFAVVRKQWAIIWGIITFIIIVLVLPKTSGSTLNLLRADSSLARVGNWEQGLTLISQSPVFGHGFNTLRYLSLGTEINSKSAAGLDSSILFIGATTGIVGILAYGYLIVVMLRGTRGKFTPFLATSIAAIVVHSLFVNSAFYPWILIWMWIIVGINERLSDDT